MKKLRVLIVCFADSSHSQSWIDLFKNCTEIDVRVFASSISDGGMYPLQNWGRTTYVLNHPTKLRGTSQVISLFSDSKFSRFFSTRISARIPSLNNWFLWRVVNKWKPDIVHSLSIIPTGQFTWQSLKKTENNRPLFVVSSWGSDINLGKHKANDRQILKEIFFNCDGFISDCKRDINNALELGLRKNKLAFDFAIPVTGGIDEALGSDILPLERRNIILIPKAYEGLTNKTLPILEALSILGDRLKGYEVHLLMTSEEVKMYLGRMLETVKKYCYVHSYVTKEETINLMKRSRVMVAPSLSDGTPLTMLEAMSLGTLPLMSPLESIKEWIEDGRNGLLAHALYPNEIAYALNRALSDAELFNSASTINREIIKAKANREQIRSQIIKYYQHLSEKN